MHSIVDWDDLSVTLEWKVYAGHLAPSATPLPLPPTRTHAHARACTHTHARARAHTRVHTYARTRACTRTHVNTHARARAHNAPELCTIACRAALSAEHCAYCTALHCAALPHSATTRGIAAALAAK